MDARQDGTDDYRKLEKAARDEAAATEDPSARANLIRFAEMWAQMAEAEERHPAGEAAPPKP
jgi:hypothetical protein